jgi:nitroreductase
LIFDISQPADLEKARSCLVEGNAWAKSAPLLMLSVAKETFTRNEKPNRHGQHDVGLASENLVLQATALGLVAHQMAGYDSDKARDLFRIPQDFTPMAMIAIGYPGRVDDLPEKLREGERAPRTRKHVGEIAFQGSWANPIKGN